MAGSDVRLSALSGSYKGLPRTSAYSQEETLLRESMARVLQPCQDAVLDTKFRTKELGMARRPSAPSEPMPANLSSDQIRDAIPKLERRLGELEGIGEIIADSYDDLISIYDKLADTLVSTFGHDTIEYKRYDPGSPSYSVPLYMGRPTPDHEKQEGLRDWHVRAVRQVSTALDILREKLDDFGGSPGAGAIRAYEGLELQNDIARRATPLFKNGHYAHAVEDAVKALRDLVRLRSGSDEDGDSLMTSVFGGKDPILRFNDLATESDQSEQKGFMFLFAGAVAGLRNPRAHDFIRDDPERALEFIAFVSLLAKLLDETKPKDKT